MDKAKENAQFEHSAENTRLENQPNPLLEHVKAQVSEQETARQSRREVQEPKHGFAHK